MKLTEAQARIAVPLLNSYAHQYLGIAIEDLIVTAARKGRRWWLFVGTKQGCEVVDDFDAAKAIIDATPAGRAALSEDR